MVVAVAFLFELLTLVERDGDDVEFLFVAAAVVVDFFVAVFFVVERLRVTRCSTLAAVVVVDGGCC